MFTKSTQETWQTHEGNMMIVSFVLICSNKTVTDF